MPHSEHISKVYKNGGKGWGRQNSTYHPMLMTWAITLLAHTSSGTYNEVPKLMMLPHIRTSYRKMVVCQHHFQHEIGKINNLNNTNEVKILTFAIDQ